MKIFMLFEPRNFGLQEVEWCWHTKLWLCQHKACATLKSFTASHMRTCISSTSHVRIRIR